MMTHPVGVLNSCAAYILQILNAGGRTSTQPPADLFTSTIASAPPLDVSYLFSPVPLQDVDFLRRQIVFFGERHNFNVDAWYRTVSSLDVPFLSYLLVINFVMDNYVIEGPIPSFLIQAVGRTGRPYLLILLQLRSSFQRLAPEDRAAVRTHFLESLTCNHVPLDPLTPAGALLREITVFADLFAGENIPFRVCAEACKPYSDRPEPMICDG